jgi:hypothetical protein
MAVSSGRVHQEYVEVLSKGDSFGRVQHQYVEALSKGDSSGRVQQQYIEVLAYALAAARIYQQYVEVLTPTQTYLDESADNTLTLTQSATREMVFSPIASNTLVLDHLASLASLLAADSTLVLTSDADCIRAFPRTATNTLSLTQQVNLSRDFLVESELTLVDVAYRVIDVDADNTLVLSGDALGLKLISVVTSSTLTLAQVLDPDLTLERVVSQGMALTQAATRTISRLIAVPQSLTLVQVVVASVTKLASSTLVLDHEAEVLLGKRASNFIELTQTVFVSPIYLRSLLTTLPMGQTLSASKTYRRTLTSTLNLTQTAVGQAVRFTGNTLALTHEAIGEPSKLITNELYLEDSVDLTRSFAMPVEHSLFFDIDCSVILSRAVSATSAFGMNQVARGTRVLSHVASSSLTFTQQLIRDLTIEDIGDTLALTQLAVYAKIVDRTITDALTLNQAVGLAKDVVRTVSQTLVFKHSRRRDLGLGDGAGGDGDSGGGSGGDDGDADIPEVIPVIIQNLVILKSGDQVITLPPPEFNDAEASLSRINIKRAMSGDRRVYKRESLVKRISYSFVLDRKKAIELRDFLLANNSKIIDMENWKGELWKVLITNSPFQFTETALWQSDWGNKSEITLEFKGARLN